jgi:hypothetical protein
MEIIGIPYKRCHIRFGLGFEIIFFNPNTLLVGKEDIESVIITDECFFNCFLPLMGIVNSIFAFEAVAHLRAHLPACETLTIHLEAFAFLAIALEVRDCSLGDDHVHFGLEFFRHGVEGYRFLNVRLIEGRGSSRWHILIVMRGSLLPLGTRPSGKAARTAPAVGSKITPRTYSKDPLQALLRSRATPGPDRKPSEKDSQLVFSGP